VALFLSITGLALSVGAQTFTPLYSFDPEDADIPGTVVDPSSTTSSGIIAQGRDGYLYSTSPLGGQYAHGTAFKISPTGILTVIYAFTGGTDGSRALGGLTLGSDGNLYGTAAAGGTSNLGTVFSMTPSGTLNCVHSFSGTDGSFPYAPPIEGPDGNFYGTVQQGGSSEGVVYKMTPACVVTNVYSLVLYALPEAPLVLASDRNFYGTTYGGGTGGPGTVFRMTPAGVITTIHNFAYTDGAQPYAPVIQGSDGNLYGTTYLGGANNYGVVFQVTLSGKFTVLHSFSSSDGTNPQAGLVQATDGNFYGATTSGGGSGGGTLFKITSKGVFTSLFNFTANTSSGYVPQVTLVQHTNGVLYGDTVNGGIPPGEPGEVTGFGQGVIYSLNVGLKPFVSLLTRFGKVGASIGILGQGFTGATAVSFHGVQASFTFVSDTYLTAAVPEGALTGVVTVTTPTGNLVSGKTFLVTPTITSFSPTSGSVGTQVVISGSGLTQTSQVKFGGVKATVFTVNSDSQITATVPTGANTGKITVKTAGGTATSSGTFVLM
jgi:uncharacterized repeat protein (TIGR03803 family)